MNAKDVPQDDLGALLHGLGDFIDDRGFSVQGGRAIDSKDICDAVLKEGEELDEFAGLFEPFFPELDIAHGAFPNVRQLGQLLGALAGKVHAESRLTIARVEGGWSVQKAPPAAIGHQAAPAEHDRPKARSPRRLSDDLFLALNECVRQFGTKFSNGKRLRTIDLARAIAREEPAAKELWKRLAHITGYEAGRKPPNTRVLGHLLSRTRNMRAEGWCVCTSPGFWWVEEGAGRGDPAAEKVAERTKKRKNSAAAENCIL